MVSTWIYLSDHQRAELVAMSKASGKKQSELIREAVDCFIGEAARHRRGIILKQAAGMWKDRSDLPGFSTIRSKND